jgi:hypothetical protein
MVVKLAVTMLPQFFTQDLEYVLANSIFCDMKDLLESIKASVVHV